MDFCCLQFKWRWIERNERGSSIYVCPPRLGAPALSFVLLSRGIKKGGEEVLGQISRGTKLEVNISSRIRIHFCPWCGCELKKYYADSFQSLIDADILVEMKENGANQALQHNDHDCHGSCSEQHAPRQP